MKPKELDIIFEEILTNEIRKSILEQNQDKKEVIHVMCDGEPIDTYHDMDEAQSNLETYKKNHPDKEFIIEKGQYESHDHMIDKLDEMGEQLEQKDNNQNMEKPKVKTLAEAVLHARENGIKKFKINENIYDTDECWKNMEEEEGVTDESECSECGENDIDEFFQGDLEDLGLEKGKKYQYRTPSFEDDIEYDERADYDKGEPMFKFKGQKGDSHLLGKDHIKNHVSEDDMDENSGSKHREWWNTLQPDDQQTHMSTHFPDNEFGALAASNNDIKQIHDKIHHKHHKEIMPGIDLGKSFDKFKSLEESKKKVIRLTETQMREFLTTMVMESGVPSVTKKAQTGSKTENNKNIKDVNKKMKNELSFEKKENDKSVPEPIEKGKKNKNVVKFNNTKEEDQIVTDNRGYGLQHLKYDHEPSEQFKQRLKDALEGSSKMGNSQDAANVIKTDTGKNIVKNSEKKKKQDAEQPMYNKDTQPVKIVKETVLSKSMVEELGKMKNLTNYNQKTQ